jgi:hypothetical protein
MHKIIFPQLTIQVEDYNDYAPVFRESSYTKKISESFELEEEIVTVTADDKDTGVNQKISYSIVAGNDEGRRVLFTTVPVYESKCGIILFFIIQESSRSMTRQAW